MKKKDDGLPYDVRRAWKSLMMSCNARSISFELSTEEFAEIVSRPCSYCGRRSKVIVRMKNPRDDDGYTVKTSESICEVCEKMKSKYTREAFLKYLNHVIEYTSEHDSRFDVIATGESTDKDARVFLRILKNIPPAYPVALTFEQLKALNETVGGDAHDYSKAVDKVLDDDHPVRVKATKLRRAPDPLPEIVEATDDPEGFHADMVTRYEAMDEEPQPDELDGKDVSASSLEGLDVRDIAELDVDEYVNSDGERQNAAHNGRWQSLKKFKKLVKKAGL